MDRFRCCLLGWDGGGDTNGGVNERVLSTLLNEMDGVEGRNGVIVIGCTNRPHQIDDAILRPGIISLHNIMTFSLIHWSTG